MIAALLWVLLGVYLTGVLVVMLLPTVLLQGSFFGGPEGLADWMTLVLIALLWPILLVTNIYEMLRHK